MSHQTHLVLARDLYEERLPGDEPEELEVVPWKLDALDQLILREDFSEGRSIAACSSCANGCACRRPIDDDDRRCTARRRDLAWHNRPPSRSSGSTSSPSKSNASPTAVRSPRPISPRTKSSSKGSKS
jgi:hypothetical protein